MNIDAYSWNIFLLSWNIISCQNFPLIKATMSRSNCNGCKNRCCCPIIGFQGPQGGTGAQGPPGIEGPQGPNLGYQFSESAPSVGPRFIGQGHTGGLDTAGYAICQETIISTFHVAVTNFPLAPPAITATFMLFAAPCLATVQGVTAGYGPFALVPGFTQTISPTTSSACQFMFVTPVVLTAGSLIVIQVVPSNPTLPFYATAAIC